MSAKGLGALWKGMAPDEQHAFQVRARMQGQHQVRACCSRARSKVASEAGSHAACAELAADVHAAWALAARLPCVARAAPQDAAAQEKERVAAEIAAMDPAVVAAARQAAAGARKAKADAKRQAGGAKESGGKENGGGEEGGGQPAKEKKRKAGDKDKAASRCGAARARGLLRGAGVAARRSSIRMLGSCAAQRTAPVPAAC